MRVYYLDAEYEPGKHEIVKVWAEVLDVAMPEDLAWTAINAPYSVLELDERYNRALAIGLLTNKQSGPHEDLPDKYYVGTGEILRDQEGTAVTIKTNPQRESWKGSILYGKTQAEVDAYIDANVTSLAEAKAFLKKLGAVVLWLVKQTQLDQ